jgi:hypothetical protein
MGGSREKTGSGTPSKGGAESRKERLAQALRANLKRRKQSGSGDRQGDKDRKSSGGGAGGH